MLGGRQIVSLIKDPHRFLTAQLEEPDTVVSLFFGVALPLMLLRAIAVLVRSLFFGTFWPGVVLAIGSLALQLGVWLGLALVLPAIARQFHGSLRDRDAFLLATYASVPMWLAGVFYVAPEEQWFLTLWSRLLVYSVGAYGLYIMARGLLILGIEKKALPGVLTATGIAYVTMYLPLSLLLAFAAHIVLFVFGAN